MTKLQKRSVIGVLAALLVGLSVIMLRSTASGPMSLSEDAQKLHENTVYGDTVTYYSNVCDALNSVNTASRDVLNVSETSIGQDPEEAKADYEASLERLRATTNDASRKVSELNIDAPKVMLPNNTFIDYAGALDETERVLNENSSKLDEQANVIKSVDSSNENASAAYTTTLTDVAETNGAVRSSLSSVFDKATILSQPTINQLKNASPCASIIGGPMSDEEHRDVKVDALVDLKNTLYVAHDAFTLSAFYLSDVSEFTGADEQTLTDLVAGSLEKAENESRRAVSVLDKWSNPYDENTPEWQVTNKHAKLRDSTQDSLSAFANELHATRDEIENSGDVGVSTVENAFENHSDALRDAQINVARSFARANLDFDPVTVPTSDAVKELHNPADDEVDTSLVEQYTELHGSRQSVIDSVQRLSDTASSVEGMSIDNALSTLASAVNDVAAAISNAPFKNDETLGASQDLYILANEIESLTAYNVNDQLPSIMERVSAAQTRALTEMARERDRLEPGNYQTRNEVQQLGAE